jgi:mRNA interferase HigB
VDFVAGNRVIFDIGGNKCRLVVKIDYGVGLVLIRFVGVHAAYDRIDARTV